MPTTTAAARINSVIETLAGNDPGSRLRKVSIPAREGEALARWVSQEKASRTIEIGLAYGMSALHICRALFESGNSDARHVAIDPFQDKFDNRGLQALDDAGVRAMVEFHGEMSQIALPMFLKDGRRFDFAFVDGNHRFDSVFLDLFYLGRLVRPGAVIVLDDYQLPGIRRAVNFFLTNLNWHLEEVSTNDDQHHWAAVRTSKTEDTRDFRFFVEF